MSGRRKMNSRYSPLSVSSIGVPHDTRTGRVANSTLVPLMSRVTSHSPVPSSDRSPFWLESM